MAETVKKSRIVSEDDLEESLMQEFNMRLKTCMSSDRLNDEDEDDAENPENIYENIEVIKTNGRKEPVVPELINRVESPKAGPRLELAEQETMPEIEIETVEFEAEEPEPLNRHNKLNSIEEFIQIERECLQQEQNGVEVENDEFLGPEDPVGRELDAQVETQIIETLELSEPNINETKSVRDRMFLSTDSASCLLFTQTVTSPMLTPSEERVDFIRGFQGDSAQNTLSDDSNITPKSEDDAEIVDEEKSPEILDREAEEKSPELGERNPQEVEEKNPEEVEERNPEVEERNPEVEERNPEFEEKNPGYEEINPEVEVINPEVEEKSPEIIADYPKSPEFRSPPELVLEKSPELIEDFTVNSVDLLRDVPNAKHLNGNSDRPEIIEVKPRTTSPNPKQKYMESITKELSKEAALPKVECKIPSVQSLKHQYILTATTDTTKSSEKNEISNLKTLDIMKQISKFEQISPKDDNIDNNSSTETTYVETTTVETKSTGQEKSLKKKKTKKSRSHEKENISVNGDSYHEESFYNVNVKSLCRSFGDLTKIGELSNGNDFKSRAKSMSDIRMAGCVRPLENVFKGVSVKALRDKFNNPTANSVRTVRTFNIPEPKAQAKSSFSKFDALQKKNVLHVRSSDSSKAQEKFNGNQIDNTNCKSCGKIVFQMEQMKAEKSIWHKNCFRCTECNKQLTVDTYQSNEGTLYCKPHFKALFAPKAVEDDTPQKPRKHEMIIRENQPQELPPDVVRASDKPDLGLEELQTLNVKERFQVFEHHDDESNLLERNSSAVNVKRSPSILSKLARFQAKGMDIGVADESLNGIPIEESSTDEEEVEELDGEDMDLVRAKRAQREKPFHFVGMSDVKSKWEHGDQNGKDERREERKQEIQSIRNRLFMGKQGKMKEMYQQAVMESESGANVKKTEQIEVTDTRSLKERFEKGPSQSEGKERQDSEDMSMFETGITKKSRSIFLELDANASKAPQISPVSPVKGDNVRKGREVYLARQTSEDVVKSTEAVEDVTVQTADIQQRFNFFETYKEPEKKKRTFRITPPRDGQVKVESPDREVYRDPEVIRSEEYIEDSVVAKQTQTAKKMLNKFRQMEEDLSKDQVPLGPKPLKRFTPPPEPIRSESESEEEVTESEEESDEEDGVDHGRSHDDDLLEAQKAARAKQLRAKFEKWEANEIKREQNQSSVNIVEEFGEEQSQIESTKSLRARFEQMKESPRDENKAPRVKVNRFV